MFLRLTRISKEAYFDCERHDWYNGKATTRDIFHPLEVETVLVNCDHISTVTPYEYRSAMQANTPDRNAESKWLLSAQGACVTMTNGGYYNVTENISKIDAAIGTQYVVEQC